MAHRYLITSPTSAAVQQRPRKVVMVPKGSVINVPISLDGVRGLIEVTFNGEAVLMFAEDIRDRGELISGASGEARRTKEEV